MYASNSIIAKLFLIVRRSSICFKIQTITLVLMLIYVISDGDNSRTLGDRYPWNNCKVTTELESLNVVLQHEKSCTYYNGIKDFIKLANVMFVAENAKKPGFECFTNA